ncbi:MAG: hypothetical protein PHT95_02030 [Candidatus Omnitrophica bacterium]|nr:hypothetical protein [Candidatus Omnitrophota bacterium]
MFVNEINSYYGQDDLFSISAGFSQSKIYVLKGKRENLSWNFPHVPDKNPEWSYLEIGVQRSLWKSKVLG